MVKDKGELYVQLDNLLSDPERARRMGERAFRIIEANSGAAKKTLDAIGRLIVAH
jgi:3-deoxy-D-manno-octulosonic-acid transferase